MHDFLVHVITDDVQRHSSLNQEFLLYDPLNDRLDVDWGSGV